MPRPTVLPTGATSMASAESLPEDHVPDLVRVLSGATRWYALPLCLLLFHRVSHTRWSRWAYGWDREATCVRCGKVWHERVRAPARF